jgi:limonene-1,2-epoxide hydrolase
MRPIDVVKEFMSAMEVMDYDRALALVTDDCEYVNMPMGAVKGPDGIRSVLEPFFGALLENEFVIRTIVAEGDTVFVERLDRHRIQDGWFELPVAGVLELRDGRIAAWREYFDMATLEKGYAVQAG